ncbi:hypothetical protein [Streptomyces otsuchiensis]|uniref:hypothetical protein n=1 Tax=Streptomyces otsuchiensis TaxID=2681388 RepID=UPI00102FB6B0|nr:hypothetical protein [Streptomyces otsuchiensis]
MTGEQTSAPESESEGAESSESASRGRRALPWWARTGALAAAVVLLLLAALPPWSGGLAGPGEGVGWWPAAPALAAAVLLVGGLGARRSLVAAACAATSAAVLALVSYLRAPGAPTDPSPRLAEVAFPPDRPSAALALAVAALLAAVVCVVLARRPGPWLPREGDRRARGRRLLAAGTVASLVGGLLSTGAGYGADRARSALADGPYYDAVSEPLPSGQRKEGVEVTAAEHGEPLPHLEPTGVGWQGSLPGPAELTTCLLAQPQHREDGYVKPEHRGEQRVARSTLVSIEHQDDADAVIGYDPADGSERWRYTVRHGELVVPDDGDEDRVAVRLGQVAVSPFCAVHVVIDPITLVTLDGNSGEVLREERLPGPGSHPDRSRNWTFVTDSVVTEWWDEESGDDSLFGWRPLVALGQTTRVYLRSSSHLAEFTDAGELRGLGARDQCHTLAVPRVIGHARSASRAVLLTQSCGSAQADFVEVPPGPAAFSGSGTAHLDLDLAAVRPVAPERAERVPALGCEWIPRISQMAQASRGIALVGRWCDRFEGPLVMQYNRERDMISVVELPSATELPLRVIDHQGVGPMSWISEGEIHQIGDRREEIAEADWPRTIVATESRRVFAAGEPVEAAVGGGAQIPVGSYLDPHQLFYAVGESGTVLALAWSDFDSDAEPSVYGELPEAAGPCAGTRELMLDRPGLRLLVTCETEAGTEVTAIETKRLTEAEHTHSGSSASSWAGR